MNNIYSKAVSELSTIFGAFSNLDSGTGARTTSAKKGKMTIYHRNIAAGNSAEIAFEIESIGTKLKLNETETRGFLADLKSLTGRPVELNARYQWPRVGLSKDEDVAKVMDAIRKQIER